MTEECDFILALDASPEDQIVRSMYADWLEEHEDPRASVYRLLSRLKLYPIKWANGWMWLRPGFSSLPKSFLPAVLPWWDALDKPRVWWKSYGTRQEAEEDAVAVFLRLALH